jgi:hypothetical protein
VRTRIASPDNVSQGQSLAGVESNLARIEFGYKRMAHQLMLWEQMSTGTFSMRHRARSIAQTLQALTPLSAYGERAAVRAPNAISLCEEGLA